MFSSNLCIPVFVLLIGLNRAIWSSGITLKYTLTTKFLSTMSLSDPLVNEYLEDWEFDLYITQPVQKYLKDIKSIQILPKVSKTVKNLYNVLKHFMDDKCLIVINNFEGADIFPTIEFPLMLRQFDIALGRAEYTHKMEKYNSINTLWVPKEIISKLNGNFSTKISRKLLQSAWCETSKYLYSLWPVANQNQGCLGPKSLKFHLLSIPWQCEIQVDLFMPDRLFLLAKQTKVFDNNLRTWMRYKILPSLRPPVHLKVDTKAEVDEYDWMSMASWTIRQSLEEENE